MGLLVQCPCEASRPGKLSRPSDISLPERDQCERNRSRGGGAGPGSAPCFRGAHRGFVGQATLSTLSQAGSRKDAEKGGKHSWGSLRLMTPLAKPVSTSSEKPISWPFPTTLFLCDFCRPLFSHLKVNILPQMLSHVRGSDADCCGGCPIFHSVHLILRWE